MAWWAKRDFQQLDDQYINNDMNSEDDIVSKIEYQIRDEENGINTIFKDAANTALFISGNGLFPEVGAGPSSPNISTFLSTTMRYRKGGTMSIMMHIKKRHWFNTEYAETSIFTPGTSSATVSNYIKQALKFGKRVQQQDGSISIRYDLGKIIGTGSNGVATSEIQVYIRNAIPNTAFPIN